MEATVPLAVSVEDDRIVADMFAQEAVSLVRMARLFVDDRNAAEDIVQEAFLRLRRSLHRIADPTKAVAYLRSIVLNLARDHNRKGLVSLRHHASSRTDVDADPAADELVLQESQREVVEALRTLPLRQRDCLVLRYYLELSVPDIAETLGVSPNSVKTHLQRGLAALEKRLETTR
jgi:RNA polymerase sigma-70 factor (sigma-E family)